MTRFPITYTKITLGLILAAVLIYLEGTLSLRVAAVLTLLGFAFLVTRYRAKILDAREQDAREAMEAASALPRLVGASCSDCGRRIAMEIHAKHCPACSLPTHDTCMARHQANAHAGVAYRS